MHILINGQNREFSSVNRLNQIIEQFCKDSKHVIAELNGAIVKPPRWNETPVKDGDTLELVNLVGGG